MERAEEFVQHLGPTTPFPLLIDIDKAEGLYIYDKDGNAYMDLIAGVSVSNIGHRHPRVINAIKQQLDKHMHVMVYGEFIQDSQLDLANELRSILPKELDAVYFVNSGTEANEAALKLAKRYTGRSKMVALQGAYHGSTHGSLSVSGNEYKKYAFRPLLPNVYHIEYGNYDDLQEIDEETACLIIEVIQGDAGVRVPDKNYITALRKRCDEVGALLIVDEIQTGFGRTGTWFACEHYELVPDVITIAKGLGGGMPIGAFCARAEVMKSLSFDPFLGHITTFGGHPVNCAAAAENIRVIREEIDFKEVERKGQLLEDSLQHPLVQEIRRIGMFFAIEMENADIVQKVVEYCMEKHVISFWFLSCPEAFRIAPPLNITDEEIQKSSLIIQEAFTHVYNSLAH